MPDILDSTNKIVPPFSPLKVQIEPPAKKRERGRLPKGPRKEDERKKEDMNERGKAVDVHV